jgi:hypothetical protein
MVVALIMIRPTLRQDRRCRKIKAIHISPLPAGEKTAEKMVEKRFLNSLFDFTFMLDCICCH